MFSATLILVHLMVGFGVLSSVSDSVLLAVWISLLMYWKNTAFFSLSAYGLFLISDSDNRISACVIKPFVTVAVKNFAIICVSFFFSGALVFGIWE